jgi:rubrerythrin
MRLTFQDLGEKEILALAVSAEEEDGRIYQTLADRLQALYPATAGMFRRMAEEESGHRHRLLERYQARFGQTLPLIRRSDVKGFLQRPPLWLAEKLSLGPVRRLAAEMEGDARRYYLAAAERTTDAETRKLLGDLATAEAAHEALAQDIRTELEAGEAGQTEEESQRKSFILSVVQPGLAGLMDGSVSTLAPIFAAAFATRNSWDAFLVGMAASVGAGISMGLTEALADDGKLSGRGSPWLRGWVCGLMTAAGGLGHTLPYLIPGFQLATTVAIVVVAIELGVIAWVRHHYMDTPLLSAMFQIVVGGILVFLVGIVIGSQ